MTLVEISEREVIEKAKAWAAMVKQHDFDLGPEETELAQAVTLLEAGDTGWRPDFKCPCGYEAKGAGAATYRFCPNCGKDRLADNLERDPSLDDTQEMPAVEPITRPPRKLSRRDQEIEKRRQSDPLGSSREDIDYSSIEDPSVR